MPPTGLQPSWMLWIRPSPTFIRNPDPLAVNLYTEYEGSDQSFGLISRLGYDQYLAEYLAREIVQALKNLYNIQGPTGGEFS